MKSALAWHITQRIVVILYRRFKTTYPSHLQESRNPGSWIYSNLKMGQREFPETSVRNYQYTLRNIPEEHRFNLLLDGSLKSREVMSTFRICCFGNIMSHKSQLST